MARLKVGNGQGGKSLNDRELASRVRTKALECIEAVLKETPESLKFGEYKKQLLLSLSKSILPRLNEVSGPDGSAIQLSGVEISVRKNES